MFCVCVFTSSKLQIYRTRVNWERSNKMKNYKRYLIWRISLSLLWPFNGQPSSKNISITLKVLVKRSHHFVATSFNMVGICCDLLNIIIFDQIGQTLGKTYVTDPGMFQSLIHILCQGCLMRMPNDNNVVDKWSNDRISRNYEKILLFSFLVEQQADPNVCILIKLLGTTS